jgi:pimeloyl-ACP methyl ester carboxylesterase
VRFCPTSALAQRVSSFDGAPLDVDVTLAATGNGPFPTIVMLHGWSGDKTSLSPAPNGGGNETYRYNNVYYAQHGYAVINYSAAEQRARVYEEQDPAAGREVRGVD